MVLAVLLSLCSVVTVGAESLMWSQTYGGTSADYAYSLVETSDGGYALAGITYSFGAGLADFWLIKTDASGNMEWNQTYGGTNSETTSALVATSDGGYAIAGSIVAPGFPPSPEGACLIKTDEFGSMEWNQTYDEGYRSYAYSLLVTSDGGYTVAGYTSPSFTDAADFWLVKTDETGYVPEYSSWLFPSLLLVATLFIVINKKWLTKTPRDI